MNFREVLLNASECIGIETEKKNERKRNECGEKKFK